MTYTYFVSAKKRTALQRVFAGFMVLSLNLSMGGALAFVAPSVASAIVVPTIWGSGFESNTLGDWDSHDSDWHEDATQALTGSKSIRIEADTSGSGDVYVSKAISIVGYQNVNATFSYFITDNLESSDYVKLQITTDGGANWSTVIGSTVSGEDVGTSWKTRGPLAVTSLANNNANVQVRFAAHLKKSPGNKDQIYIDDFLLTGTPITHTLQVATSGTGSGSVTSAPVGISCGADCSEIYNSGTTVVLTQSANPGSTFGSWTGCDSSTATTCTVNMSGNKTVSASFALALVPENTDGRCEDGIDNDGDGKTDLADNDCRGGLTVTKTVVNGPHVGMPEAFTLKVCPTTAPVLTLLGVKTAYASPVADPCVTVMSDALTFLEPGWYQVSEIPVANYNLSFTSGQCDLKDGIVHIGRGDNDSCGMMNSYDLCPNMEGNQPEVPAGRELNNDGQCVPVAVPACANDLDDDGDGLTDYPADLGCTSATDNDELNTAPTCEEKTSTMTVVSDESNNVLETSLLAFSTYMPTEWTTIPDATWIWSSEYVLAPTTNETKTFTKTFPVSGTVTGATLSFAADNDYVIWVNNTQVASSSPEAAGYNFSSATTITVPTTLFVQGDNEIKMEVTNLALSGATPKSNPAGALYKLTLTKNACVPTPTPVCNPEVNLLENAGFEAPVVSGWEIIPFTNSALKWLGNWVTSEDGGRLGLELQASVAGSPFAGVQHAELDGDHPVKIWQNVPLMAGYDYELSTMYSPRPGSNAADNTLQFQLNGLALGADVSRDGSANANTVWTKESRIFTAGAASADVGFAETGTDSSIGVYLDNTALRCIEKHVPKATIVATKIVCDEESDLPNWSGSAQVIDASTATAYVAEHEGCEIIPDWQFQWAPVSASNPGDNTGLAAGWNTFVSSVSITLGDMTSVWMREVFDPAYIPFTGTADTDKVSAELYCNGDVLHYDNLDYARNLTDGATVYCVAFNVLKEEVPPPTDVCLNLEGTQTTVPEGLILMGDQCVPFIPGIDLCPNIQGAQGDIPPGMSLSDGMCIETPVRDMCLNIEGVQSEVPTGMTANTDHQCTGGSNGPGSTDSPYPGCMNPEAKNFNRLANQDDGTCDLPKHEQQGGGDEQKPAGEVLGAATTEPDLSLPASCGEYLSDYLRYGKKNNAEQVKLLQEFLNEFVDANLPVTGYFGKMTHSAVKKFQVKYHSEIIKPWVDAGFKDKDIENGTGYVFKTTKREINLLKCASLNIPMPDLKAQ